jgi:hypothetical protein
LYQAASSKYQAASSKYQAASIKQQVSSSKYQAASIKQQERIQYRACSEISDNELSVLCTAFRSQKLAVKDYKALQSITKHYPVL